ncbi:hypothetical protein R1A27_04895 [Methylobacterium sp. NMS12]|uniref:hypothetical protein n=1 Tax=Methylobacterium sp. NMS12 TaxID=3079766 RepID=UPI003F882C08
MSERFLLRSGWCASDCRVLLAALLGHYAAAYCFCAATMFSGFVDDFREQGLSVFAGASWSRAVEIAWTAPVVTGLLGFWGAVVISPSLLLTLPITRWAARKLDTAALPTAAIGTVPGLLIGLVVFWSAPRIEPAFLVSSAFGGAAFAWVVWMLCIRPRWA